MTVIFILLKNQLSILNKTILDHIYIYIYDWGIKKSNIDKLLLINNLKIINWKSNIIKIKNYQFSYQDNKYLKIISNSIFNKKNYFKFCLRKIIIKFKYPQYIYKRYIKLFKNHFIFEKLLLEKIEVFLDFSKKIGNKKFIFTDSDVIINKNLNHVYYKNSDLCFTLKKNLNFNLNKGGVINSGVIFFGKNANRRKIFLEEWNKESKFSNEFLKEQSSLTRFLQKKIKKNFFKINKYCKIKIKNFSINIGFLNGDIYNFQEIEKCLIENINLSNINIFHFKGLRQKKNNFFNLYKKLRLDS